MKKKYLLCPGKIISLNDGNEHYLSPVMLKNLYKVNMKECLIDNHTVSGSAKRGLIKLEPDAIEEYKIPKE